MIGNPTFKLRDDGRTAIVPPTREGVNGWDELGGMSGLKQVGSEWA